MSQKKGASKSAERERRKLQERLDGFDWNKSEAKQWIMDNYGTELKQFELLQVCERFLEELRRTDPEKAAKMKIDRECKRRLTQLQKWVSDNFKDLREFLRHIVFEDINGGLHGPMKDQMLAAGALGHELAPERETNVARTEDLQGAFGILDDSDEEETLH